nr:MAG: hypothetical protein [Sanya tombus-like virus 6]
MTISGSTQPGRAGLALGCLISASISAYAVYRFFSRSDSWRTALSLFDKMSDLDDGVLRPETDGVVGIRKLSRAAYLAAIAFKEKYGEMKYTTANRLVAGEFVRCWLRDNYPDMRTCDRVRHATIAVEWCLTPLPAAVEVAEMQQSRSILERRAAVSCPR